ncbi:MAG: hypothetical protein RLZZ144_792 [Pseudomonadota bacterium]
MHYYPKQLNLFAQFVLMLGLFLAFGGASAEGIVVGRTASELTDKGYQFSTRYKISPSPVVENALRHGVVLNFISTIAITRSRAYWLDSEIFHEQQITKLSYNALTKQFRIARGAIFQGFSDLDSALRVLGQQAFSPISPELFNVTETYLQKISQGYLGNWLKNGVSYIVLVEMKLDTSQLPKPLQVNALAGNEWNLSSEAYRWQFVPQLTEGDETP